MSQEENVAGLYDADPEREWARLDERKVELGVTSRVLKDFLPEPPARILDVGSGPGRYAIPLSLAGYEVSLVDISGKCLDLAGPEAARGCEGVVSEVEERLNDLAEDKLAKWIDLNCRLGKRPELLASSAHVLHIGRRL